MASAEAKSLDIKEIVKQSYDKIAPAYLTWTLSRSSPRTEYLARLSRNLSSGSTVLELGCGNGVPVTETLSQNKQIDKVVANDISEEQIKLARGRCSQWGNKVEFIADDMMKLEFDEATFDGAAAFFSVFHLPRAEQPEMIKSIHRWLKPGAILVCNFSASDAETRAQAEEKVECWESFEAEMFWSGVGIEGSKTMMTEAGFELLAADVRSANEDLGTSIDPDQTDPDHDVEFLWIVARKPPGKMM